MKALVSNAVLERAGSSAMHTSGMGAGGGLNSKQQKSGRINACPQNVHDLTLPQKLQYAWNSGQKSSQVANNNARQFALRTQTLNCV
jgi:hypothetical protein|mmetsp:Transcript_44382/g.72199  ORF Transcript_44382/g.72199 Transcript_44382/m.72199 type:complete len:87 (+) Transcript_44382:475-735(+)|eukprot:CAMPEP_0174378324 /NCGR_PEP_ID=MMETSP0811_2-20130205/121962_1 /TAXON_ID=73025 ORGANISM="Eutreptiella gymnastica-like, Strain CCMP1594" /NCGR_SAMPLE_ID=MMETSP0811_2 /ASSEMBLY_ACC=CAM_ASM_000667 /LENGTH=86 /DNA_ID=CAMNT_0015530507 /DNA_START=1692 /DNA_END=1952 /DNA_ORIENTATION=+